MPIGGSGTGMPTIATVPGSGSGFPGTGMPTGPGGSGSGMPPTGPGGSGMPPMPPTGSGSGMPGGGYGECAPGFLKVCPEMDGACPMDSMPVCPAPMTMPMGRSLDRMVGQMGSSDGCECVPMVLMQMVMTQQMVGMRADTRGAEVFEDESVKVGKKTCTCDFSFTMAGNKVKKAAGTCDKKCSGNVKSLTLNNDDWSFKFGFGVKKGKVKMGKVTAVGGSTGGGSGGSGSGGAGGSGMPGGPGMPGGSGMPGGGYGHSGCVCVHMPSDMGGSGMPPMPPTGSGSGTGPGSGSGATPLPPTGGNGTGTTSAPRVITWSFGMSEAVECVKPGTSVIFEWSGSSHNVDKVGSAEDYASCSGITDTTGVSGPYTWQAPISEGNHYFVCGIGIHCSVGNMKAAIEVSNNC